MASFELKQAAELAEVDDWSSAWEDCKRLGIKWGGRGRGGRAAGRMTVQSRDVVLEGCTLSYLSNNLLDRTTLRLLHGHRYGLIGRNGVGKSTLLRRIATGTLPGFPTHIRVSQVLQDVNIEGGDMSLNPVDYLVQCNHDRMETEAAIARLEASECPPSQVEEQAELLSSLYDALEEDGQATGRATKILKDLGFSETRRSTPIRDMSGGWRMRVAIAMALFQEPMVLLLDEPTNHLDIEGVEWLKSYLLGPAAEADLTVVITSHDRAFLDAVCTDIIRFHKQQLFYYPGNYTDYETARHDKELSLAKTQEGIDKQRKHIEESIHRLQSYAAKSEGKTGMVASRKKKLDRLGAEKNIHGHRFRAQQDSYEGMSAVRAGSNNEIALGRKTGEHRSLAEGPERESKMTIPSPPPLGSFGPLFSIRCITAGYLESPMTDEALVAAVEASGHYFGPPPVAAQVPTNALKRSGKKAAPPATPTPAPTVPGVKIVLKNVSIDIEQNAKVAIMGKNGSGKSTLMSLMIECTSGSNEGAHRVSPTSNLVVLGGELSRHPGFRLAYYQQNLQDQLPFDKSPLEYMLSVCPSGTSEQVVRGHLGSFGLSGDIVLRPISTLSGGQKVRIVLAQLTLNRPNLLLLDEPTNNLDLDAIRALGEAVKAYEGAAVIASHDVSFVSETCQDVYYINNGEVSRLEGGIPEYRDIVQAAVAKQKRIIS